MVKGRESWSPGEACPSSRCYTALSVPSDAACLTWHVFGVMVTLASMAWVGAAIKSPDYNFATDNCLLSDCVFLNLSKFQNCFLYYVMF